MHRRGTLLIAAPGPENAFQTDNLSPAAHSDSLAVNFLESGVWVGRHSEDKTEGPAIIVVPHLTISISVVLQVDLLRLCKTSPQRLEAATLSAWARLVDPEIVCPPLLEPAVQGRRIVCCQLDPWKH
eukprot:6495860-Prymnesium_polylepis.5